MSAFQIFLTFPDERPNEGRVFSTSHVTLQLICSYVYEAFNLFWPIRVLVNVQMEVREVYFKTRDT